MNNLTPQDEKKLKKLADFLDAGELGTFKQLSVMEDKIDLIDEKVIAIAQITQESIYQVGEELKKKSTEIERVLDFDREELKGDKGDTYILTEIDKAEIAQMVIVPAIEKTVEKITVIKEQPIVTQIVKEVAVTDIPEKIRDKLESLKEDDRLDISAIKGVGKRLSKLSDDIVNKAIGILDQRTQFLINKVSNLQTTVNNIPTTPSSSGYTIETPTGALYDQSAGTGGITFTVTTTPVYIVADGTTYFDGAGYTIAAFTITMVNPVTQFIRSFRQ